MESPFKDKPNIRRYSILPARAMQDENLSYGEWRVLACLGMYSNSHGVCWPSQMRISQHLGVGIKWVSACVVRLCKKGYIRKLEHRKYKKGIKRRSGRLVNRYQILFEGNDPLPTFEQFWAPQPRFRAPDEDESLEVAEPIQKGVQGDGNKDYEILAHTFVKAVEATSGVRRLPAPSFKTAKTLADQGVKVDEVRAATVTMSKDSLGRGAAPPITLDQVAKWAGLYKN
jgi:hypothetical protein